MTVDELKGISGMISSWYWAKHLRIFFWFTLDKCGVFFLYFPHYHSKGYLCLPCPSKPERYQNCVEFRVVTSTFQTHTRGLNLKNAMKVNLEFYLIQLIRVGQQFLEAIAWCSWIGCHLFTTSCFGCISNYCNTIWTCWMLHYVTSSSMWNW